MGIKSLFSNKKKVEEKKPAIPGRVLTEEEKRNKVAVQYFNRVMKNETPIPFKFEGFSQDQKKLLYESSYREGMVYLEVVKNNNKKDVIYLVEDVLKEIDYIVHEMSRFYEADVQFYRYYVDFDHHKHVEVIVGGEHKDIKYHESLSNMVKAVNSFLSTELNVLEGQLGGRGNDFLIEEYDLMAFLKRNKGKYIRVEVIQPEEQVEEQTEVLLLDAPAPENLEESYETQEEVSEGSLYTEDELSYVQNDAAVFEEITAEIIDTEQQDETEYEKTASEEQYEAHNEELMDGEVEYIEEPEGDNIETSEESEEFYQEEVVEDSEEQGPLEETEERDFESIEDYLQYQREQATVGYQEEIDTSDEESGDSEEQTFEETEEDNQEDTSEEVETEEVPEIQQLQRVAPKKPKYRQVQKRKRN